MIVLKCQCGQKLKVDDKYAGKKIRCPKCKEVVTVSPDGDLSDLEAVPTQKMRRPDSEEFDFKTLPKLKSMDDLVDLEDEDEEDTAPPPPRTIAILMKVLGVICAVIGFSTAVAGGIFLLPPAYEESKNRADNIRSAPPPGVEGAAGEAAENQQGLGDPQ